MSITQIILKHMLFMVLGKFPPGKFPPGKFPHIKLPPGKFPLHYFFT